MGGEHPAFSFPRTSEIFDVTTGSWRPGPDFVDNLQGGPTAKVDDTFIVAGGPLEGEKHVFVTFTNCVVSRGSSIGA